MSQTSSLTRSVVTWLFFFSHVYLSRTGTSPLLACFISHAKFIYCKPITIFKKKRLDLFHFLFTHKKWTAESVKDSNVKNVLIAFSDVQIIVCVDFFGEYFFKPYV